MGLYSAESRQDLDFDLLDRRDMSPVGYQRINRETGDAVVAGRPQLSELYRRVTLEPDAEAFMPAEGKTPLTEAQVRIIRWWIEAGLPANTTLDQVGQRPDAEVEALIRTELGLASGG